MMLMKQQELDRAKTWYNKGGKQKHTKEPTSNEGTKTGATKHWEPLNDSGLSSDSGKFIISMLKKLHIVFDVSSNRF